MNVFLNLVLAVQMLVAVAMIALILIQHGKGADMGAAFGSGSSGSLFGASGGANFMSRTTGILAAIFFIATLTLAFFGNSRPTSSGSVLENALTAPSPASNASAPAAPASAAVGAALVPTPAAPASAPAAPASAASGAAQIPAK